MENTAVLCSLIPDMRIPEQNDFYLRESETAAGTFVIFVRTFKLQFLPAYPPQHPSQFFLQLQFSASQQIRLMQPTTTAERKTWYNTTVHQLFTFSQENLWVGGHLHTVAEVMRVIFCAILCGCQVVMRGCFRIVKKMLKPTHKTMLLSSIPISKITAKLMEIKWELLRMLPISHIFPTRKEQTQMSPLEFQIRFQQFQTDDFSRML